jgi:multicomponent Na+:H+ antiporter subunit B
MRRSYIGLFIFFIALVVVYQNNLIPLSDTKPISEYVIKNAYAETGAPNAVTAIYLFYRYYDTLFEALMLLFSIIAVIYMSVHEHEGDRYDE